MYRGAFPAIIGKRQIAPFAPEEAPLEPPGSEGNKGRAAMPYQIDVANYPGGEQTLAIGAGIGAQYHSLAESSYLRRGYDRVDYEIVNRQHFVTARTFMTGYGIKRGA